MAKAATAVGLDVHATKVFAAVPDAERPSVGELCAISGSRRCCGQDLTIEGAYAPPGACLAAICSRLRMISCSLLRRCWVRALRILLALRACAASSSGR